MRYEAGISVRSLVEFILRCGDIDRRFGQGRDVDLMQQGTRIHKKIQKSMGSDYSAEVSLKLPIYVEGKKVCFNEDELPGKGDSLKITLDGRADGILKKDNEIIIDEIKAINQDVEDLESPGELHLSQVRCYAFMYGKLKEKWPLKVQLTYCCIETEEIKRFTEDVDEKKLTAWFKKLILSYSKWMFFKGRWEKERNNSLSRIEFPFSYRQGQKRLAADIYRTIIRDKRIFIQAPTGVGKTISTMFPSIKAMGEGLIDKIFYLTAKTITRQAARETIEKFVPQDIRLKSITITAREKICPLDKAECNPDACEMAKGHFDRVNDAVFELITSENQITREVILDYADKHKVCPFELSLDTATWADAIIGDYNYAFDPEAKLKRFFSEGTSEKYVFLVDEAHNLVERARNMYSASLVKDDFLRMKKIIPAWNKKLLSRLETCNRDFLKQKRQCEGILVLEDIGENAFHILNLQGELEEFMKNNKRFSEREKLLEFYFSVCKFVNIYDGINSKYVIYGDFNEEGEYRLNLCCMDPSDMLSACLDLAKSSVFFSATLLPVRYYMEQLGGREEDYAVYAPSPFLKENRLVMAAGDVSTRYKRRGPKEYEKILKYLYNFSMAYKGNYMFFFPSYQMLDTIADLWEEKYNEAIIRQKSYMTEADREEFLSMFDEGNEEPVIAFCVMGGIFGEGIDLTGERLVGTAVVGTGLPMVCPERNLYKDYFDGKGKDGFKYAYQYPGMNKVMQAAGRVIRTMEDRGCVLLLDERFNERDYQELFPMEWFPYQRVNLESMGEVMGEFYRNG